MQEWLPTSTSCPKWQFGPPANEYHQSSPLADIENTENFS